MADAAIGEIRMFAGNYAPENWALCNGGTLPINGNEALYSLIGTVYGGDGRTTFGLPDLRGRIPVNQGTSAQGSTYALGQAGGLEMVSLTTANLPSHTHNFMVSTADGTVVSPSQNYLAAPVVQPTITTNNKSLVFYQPDTPSEVKAALKATAIGNAGYSQPHENRMPYISINYIICLVGIFPTLQQ